MPRRNAKRLTAGEMTAHAMAAAGWRLAEMVPEDERASAVAAAAYQVGTDGADDDLSQAIVATIIGLMLPERSGLTKGLRNKVRTAIAVAAHPTVVDDLMVRLRAEDGE